MKTSSKILVACIFIVGISFFVLQSCLYGWNVHEKPPFMLAGVLLLQMGAVFSIGLSDGDKIPKAVVLSCCVCIGLLFIAPYMPVLKL